MCWCTEQKPNDSLSARRAYIGSLEMGPLEAAVGVADVIRHEVTSFDLAFLLQRQLADTSYLEVLSQFSEEHLPAAHGNEHHFAQVIYF
jgi:hypothetical protein